MKTSSRVLTLKVNLDLDKFREEYKVNCSDEQFDTFCKAYIFVNSRKEADDTLPLHKAIRELRRSLEDGLDSLEDHQFALHALAENTHLLMDDRLASGKLTHQMHPKATGELHWWLAHALPYHFCGMAQTYSDFISEFDIDTLMMTHSKKERLKLIESWLNDTRLITAEYLASEALPQPTVDLEIIPFPWRIIATCRHKQDNGFFKLTIHEDKDDVFKLEIEWDTGTDQTKVSYGIPYRISDTHRIDEQLTPDTVAFPIYLSLIHI